MKHGLGAARFTIAVMGGLACAGCSTTTGPPQQDMDAGDGMTDGSSTDGSSTDGSSTDGSSTDGSSTDGSSTDGSSDSTSADAAPAPTVDAPSIADATPDATIADPHGPYGSCPSGPSQCALTGSTCSRDSTGSVCAPPCAGASACPALSGAALSPTCVQNQCYVPCDLQHKCPPTMTCLALPPMTTPQCGWQ
jgi:hypothetical protein